MKKGTNKIKDIKYLSEEQLEVKNFVIVFLVIVVAVVLIYFLSVAVVNKRDKALANEEVVAGNVNYNIVSVGTILNRPYDDYYVMVYDSEDKDAIVYSTLITMYGSKENSKKIYFCDLNNFVNNSYKSSTDKGNAHATKTDEFSFGKVTLINVKSNKVNSYTENIDKIKEMLS